MPRQRGWYWPWFVVGALGFTVAVNVVMMIAASSDANGSVVEPDYYRKAVAWDQAMERAAESARLGWRTTATLHRVSADSARLIVTVTGASAMPLRGARFTAELIHNVDAAHPLRAVLAESAAGRYEALVPLRRTGMWEVRLEARREADRFSTSLRAEAFTAPPVEGR
jgi:nitrogen fixation protein FixH